MFCHSHVQLFLLGKGRPDTRESQKSSPGDQRGSEIFTIKEHLRAFKILGHLIYIIVNGGGGGGGGGS